MGWFALIGIKELIKFFKSSKFKKLQKTHHAWGNFILKKLDKNQLIDLPKHKFAKDENIVKWYRSKTMELGYIYEFAGLKSEIINEKISQLKYPGEKRADEKRVAIEVTLDSDNK